MEDQLKRTNGTHDFDRTLSTPHFDDETTLLSARPVVPFHELAERTPRRRLYFGAGLVIAAMIGVLSGIFYARMAETPELRSATPAAPTAVQEDLVSTTDTLDSPEVESPEAESPEDEVVPEATTAPNVERAPKMPRPHRNPKRIVDKSASRPARTVWREPHRHRQRSDDLFRIQEIFEGSSRP
ncbi:MAG TPA: hypothetical protein VJM12_22305 [Pyrinomonadaceae bacterium]|nr:hypothetical protein [Pyrinomonadaceae bacterium]